MEYVFVVGIVAAYLQCAIGFGSAVLMINVLPFFLRASLTVVVTQFACIDFPVYMVLRLYRKVRMDVLLPVLIPSLVCTVIATRISIGMDTGTMKILLRILLVFLSACFFFVADRISLRPMRLTGAAVGLKCTTGIRGVLLRRFIYAFVGVNGIVMILNELF